MKSDINKLKAIAEKSKKKVRFYERDSYVDKFGREHHILITEYRGWGLAFTLRKSEIFNYDFQLIEVYNMATGRSSLGKNSYGTALRYDFVRNAERHLEKITGLRII